MALQKKHKEIIKSALMRAYERSPKVQMRDVAPGSLVIVRFDDHDEPPVWQTLIVFAQNKSDSKCSDLPSIYAQYGEATDINVEHDHLCAIISAVSSMEVPC